MGDLGSQPTMAVGPFAIGVRVADRYDVKALLGAGGMGSVYRARDCELDEEVALKVLRPELASTPDGLVRFRREVKLARRVTHPNVARTYDLGEHANVRFLTMELIDGPSLRDAGRLSLPEIMRIASDVAHGLAAAHAAGVVHRDLKPDNVMLAGERVVITDFGIARSADGADVMRTSGDVVGTPAYIAPEQLEGGAIDGRADVYALGVMLFELASGRLPFEGDSPTVVAFARLARPAPELRSIAPGVPEGFSRLVTDALARRREDRPDAHTFAARLAKLRGGAVDTLPKGGTFDAIPMSVSAQKTVRVATFDADDAARTLAADLARAVADAIAKVPTVRGVKEGGDLCLDGQVRASQNRVRVRLRLTDSAGEVVWVDKVEGALDDPFALEDTIAACATRALGARGARASGPEGPARERYEEARVLLEEIVDLGALGKAAALLEALDAEYPNDAWIMSLLAYALVMVENTRGALDDAVYGRAEELALRALDRDPSIGQTYYAIAVVRLHTGDARAALEAAREALRRAPMLAQAHALVGSILVQAGRLAEGMQRLDVAIRLAPKMLIAHTDRIHALALMGDRAAAEREVARLADRLGPIATIGAKLRLCCWWSDRAMAADLATLLPQQAAGMWSTALPFLKAYAAGKELEFAPLVDRMFVGLTSARVAPRHRAMMHRIAAENAMLLGRRDMALDQIAAGALLPTFIDLVWLDRCPNLTPLRDEPRFAETRAIVAERVARVVGD